MVKAQTTREQAEIAKRTGQALLAYSCKSGGTFSVDGPIGRDLAKQLNRLMAMVVTDKIPAAWLAEFLDELDP